MRQLTPRTTLTDTLFPDPTRFRSVVLDGVRVAAGARQRIATVVVGIGAGQRLPCIGGGGVVLAAVGVGTFAHALVPDLVRAPPQRAVVRRQRLLPRLAGAPQPRRAELGRATCSEHG